LTKSVKRLALLKALSERVAAGDIYSIPEFRVSSGKTRDFVKLIASVSGVSSVLVVSDSFTDETYLSARNVACVQLVLAEHVNAEDLLRFKKIVATPVALAQIAKRTSL
jgi:large subunit ribosomal protein L4